MGLSPTPGISTAHSESCSMQGFVVFVALGLEAIDSAEIDHHRMSGAIATKPNISRNRFIALRDFDPFKRRLKVVPGPFIEFQAFAETLHFAEYGALDTDRWHSRYRPVYKRRGPLRGVRPVRAALLCLHIA